MSSKYYDSAGKEVYSGDVAKSEDLNTINSAIDTGFQQVEQDLIDSTTDAEYWADLAEKWAENPEDVEVSSGKYSSLSWAAKAEEDAIATADDRVQTDLDATATAADRVQTGLDAIATAADRVQTGLDVISADADATSATASEIKAEEWAQNPEDVPVETGEFSSLHWAAKAAESAASIPLDFVASVVGTTDEIDVDNTDPTVPIVSVSPTFDRNPTINKYIEYDLTGLSTKSIDGGLYEVIYLTNADTNPTITITGMTSGRTISIIMGIATGLTFANTILWPEGEFPDLSEGVNTIVLTSGLGTTTLIGGYTLNLIAEV